MNGIQNLDVQVQAIVTYTNVVQGQMESQQPACGQNIVIEVKEKDNLIDIFSVIASHKGALSIF